MVRAANRENIMKSLATHGADEMVMKQLDAFHPRHIRADKPVCLRRGNIQANLHIWDQRPLCIFHFDKHLFRFNVAGGAAVWSYL